MKTTSKEIYLEAAEIKDYYKTLGEMLTKLETESKAQGNNNYCQVVMQLNRQEDGSKWKMFVYYVGNGKFAYSYQDENLWDTITYPGLDREEMIATMLEEPRKVAGIEWIAVDF